MRSADDPVKIRRTDEKTGRVRVSAVKGYALFKVVPRALPRAAAAAPLVTAAPVVRRTASTRWRSARWMASV